MCKEYINGREPDRPNILSGGDIYRAIYDTHKDTSITREGELYRERERERE